MRKISWQQHAAGTLRKITASGTELSPRPRGLYTTVAGTMNIENDDGSTEAAVAVFAGTVIPLQPFKITAITGATIYGFFDE